jgi:hypothetical protein
MAKKDNVKVTTRRQHVPCCVQIVFRKVNPILRVFPHTNIITYD